jgi:hypothetical protein
LRCEVEAEITSASGAFGHLNSGYAENGRENHASSTATNDIGDLMRLNRDLFQPAGALEFSASIKQSKTKV